MGDEGKAEREKRTQGGVVSSPRAYFGRASRAATGVLRTGISEMPEPIITGAKRSAIYRAGEPALRLFADLILPLPPTMPLAGAIASLTGVRDGEAEKLFVDLGTSLVRSTPRRDDETGSLTLILSRTQSAETYRGLLASLRYVNSAEAPTSGVRRLALQTVDGAGVMREVAVTTFGVGEEPPESELDPALGEDIVQGEKLSFNVEGDYTLFWWPRLLHAGTARRGAPETEPEIAGAGSYFSAGGRTYRLFDPQPERVRQPVAANDSVSAAPPPREPVWTPERRAPPPGFEAPRMLRLEDVFGSDMQDSIARRLIEMRIAAGG